MHKHESTHKLHSHFYFKMNNQFLKIEYTWIKFRFYYDRYYPANIYLLKILEKGAKCVQS